VVTSLASSVSVVASPASATGSSTTGSSTTSSSTTASGSAAVAPPGVTETQLQRRSPNELGDQRWADRATKNGNRRGGASDGEAHFPWVGASGFVQAVLIPGTRSLILFSSASSEMPCQS